MNELGAPSISVVAPSTTQPRGLTQPRGFGQILDRVFQLVRANLKPFFSIASVPAGIMVVLYAAMAAGMLFTIQPWHRPPLPVAPLRMISLTAVWVAGYALAMLAVALYFPAALHAAFAADDGRRLSCTETYALAWRKAGRYVWLMILCCLIVAGPIMVVGATVGGWMLFVVSRHGSPDSLMLMMIPFVLLLYIAAMVYAVLATLWLSLSCPACVAERLTARAAIRRSGTLTHGARGRIFLLLLVIYALVYGGVMVIELLIGMAASVAVLAGMVLHLGLNPWEFIGIGTAVAIVLAAMFAMMAASWAGYSTMLAVVYRDQRLRTEDALTEVPAG